MKEFWNMIQIAFTAIGGWAGYLIGERDGLLIALIVFITADYITGVLCALSDKCVSSQIGFRGIARKVLILLLVGVAHMLDMHVLGMAGVLRTAVIFYYLSNEGISILENAAHLGLHIPVKLKEVLEQLHERAEKGEADESRN